MMTILEIKGLVYMAKCLCIELEHALRPDLHPDTRKTMLRVAAGNAEDLASILWKYVEQENQSGKAGE